MHERTVSTLSTPIIPAAEALQIVNNIISLADEAIQTIQKETTERTRITEEARVKIAQIESQERLLMLFLERSFDERRDVFKELFRQLDRAFDEGAPAVEAVLGSINALAAKSPFADIRNVEDVRAMMKEKDREIEV